MDGESHNPKNELLLYKIISKMRIIKIFWRSDSRKNKFQKLMKDILAI